MRALVITNTITNRDERSLERYFNDISGYDLLSPEEEERLFKAYKAGDEAAYEKIILCNLRFVVSVSKKYQHLGLHLADVINEGNIGLIKAAHRFDISRGFKFISYAVWWIRQSILQAISERSRKIRLPINQGAKTRKIQNTRAEMMQWMEREPTDHELAEETEFTVSDVRNCLNNFNKCSSLDAPVSDDSAATFGELMVDEQVLPPDHNMAVHESDRVDVDRMLNSLPERDATVMSMYYGVAGQRQRTLEDISETLDLSKERVRQIMKRSISKLRAHHKEFGFSIN